MRRTLRDIPPMRPDVRRCADAILEILRSTPDDVDAMQNAAGRVTAIVDRCPALFDRFQDECLEVELLPDALGAEPDLRIGRAVLNGLRDEIERDIRGERE